MTTISCPHCTYSIPVNEITPGSKVQCPSCDESFEIPAMPPAPPVSKEGSGGGVFVLGALLLIAVVIAVVLFWGGLLKKREAPRPKHDEKKQGGFVHRQAGFWLHWTNPRGNNINSTGRARPAEYPLPWNRFVARHGMIIGYRFFSTPKFRCAGVWGSSNATHFFSSGLNTWLPFVNSALAGMARRTIQPH